MHFILHQSRLTFGTCFLALLLGLGLPAQTRVPAQTGLEAYQELKKHLDWQGAIQNAPLPDTVTMPEATPEWPGMNRFDIITGLNLLAEARVVVLQSNGGPRQAVWIKTLRGYKKANGWYGILLNGQEIDESTLYLQYGGQEINFQALMTLGSRIFSQHAPFIIEP